MKILHGPQNIGGMAGVLAKAQRECGVDAFSYCLPTGHFRYVADRTRQHLGTLRQALPFYILGGFRYDAFLFYFGTSYAGGGLYDVSILKRLGKKIYFYFCGCDIRNSKVTICQHEYSACKWCWPMLCSANRKRALDVARRYANTIFVSTPDLIEFIPESVLLPQPIDMDFFGRVRDEVKASPRNMPTDSDQIVIAHAPSNKSIKGSKYLVNAVQELREAGFAIELVLIEGKSYAETIRICSQADLIVDQLLIGSYGQFAVEMMALGKPVICYIRDDLWNYYPPGLPIVSATPNNISEVLCKLIQMRTEWDELGNRGIRYVEQNHDSVAVARLSMKYF